MKVIRLSQPASEPITVTDRAWVWLTVESGVAV